MLSNSLNNSVMYRLKIIKNRRSNTRCSQQGLDSLSEAVDWGGGGGARAVAAKQFYAVMVES